MVNLGFEVKMIGQMVKQGHKKRAFFLEDHPRNCKWLGSPPFISHEIRPFGRGPTTPGLGDENDPPWLGQPTYPSVLG